ncbi:hypothetical protein ACFY64_36045 [Streptomyces collinus]|uniref:hypothetical protein n=1 Tax=Streptomyces collinus TaxID=42684 RepID=UPI0036D15781
MTAVMPACEPVQRGNAPATAGGPAGLPVNATLSAEAGAGRPPRCRGVRRALLAVGGGAGWLVKRRAASSSG